MKPERPSQTTRGSSWLTNFRHADRPAAELLIDSLQIADPTTVRIGIREQLDLLGGRLSDGTAALLPVLAEEDITTRPGFYGPHVAYKTFSPGDPISSTPGSEGAVGNLVRELTGEQAGEEPSFWLHPGTDVKELYRRRCRLLVLVTDYAGSGTQAQRYAKTFVRCRRIRSWRSFGWLRVVVVAYAASASAQRVLQKARSIDDVLVACPAASFETAQWTEDERQQVTDICHRYLNSRQRHGWVLGYRHSAGLFAMHTGIPNNVPLILRSQRTGWHRFFDGRVFPADLAAELGTYVVDRDLGAVVKKANQARISQAIDSGRLRTPADLLVVILALVAHKQQTVTRIAYELNESQDRVRQHLDFLMETGFMTPSLQITAAGRAELRAARRLVRVATSRLEGSDEPYYPQSLR